MSAWRNGAPKPGDRAELTRTVGQDGPGRLGYEITGAVEVVEAREDKPITTVRTSVTRGDGTVVLDGTAVCYTMSLG